jgi:hypothetical protein
MKHRERSKRQTRIHAVERDAPLRAAPGELPIRCWHYDVKRRNEGGKNETQPKKLSPEHCYCWSWHGVAA